MRIATVALLVASCWGAPPIMRYADALRGCALWNTSMAPASAGSCTPVIGESLGALPVLCATPPGGMAVVCEPCVRRGWRRPPRAALRRLLRAGLTTRLT